MAQLSDEQDDNKAVSSLRHQIINAIHLAIADKDVSRAEIARRMNTSRAAVSQMLANAPNFEAGTLERIGKALGISWVLIPCSMDYRKLRWKIGQMVGHVEDDGEVCAADCLACNDPIVALMRDLREARQRASLQRRTAMYQCDGCGEIKDSCESVFVYGCEGDFCHECRHGKDCDCD